MSFSAVSNMFLAQYLEHVDVAIQLILELMNECAKILVMEVTFGSA